MSYWNYRIFRHTKDGEEWFAIHECYYDENNKVTGWTTRQIDPYGDSVEELKDVLEMMYEALDKPVLEYDDESPTEKGEINNA